MRREDDDVDVDHTKLVICDGHTADLIYAILLVCVHTQYCRAVPPHGSRRS